MLTAPTVLVPIRVSGRHGHRGYAGALVLAWRDGHRPNSIDAALARAVVAYPNAVIEKSPRAEPVVVVTSTAAACPAPELRRFAARGLPTLPSLAAPYRVLLDVRDGQVDVCLHGDIDCAAADSLAGVLALLDTITAPICIDLSKVTFLDSSGIEPVVQFARARIARGLVPVQIGSCSAAARRLLDLCQLACDDGLDVDAWDHLSV